MPGASCGTKATPLVDSRPAREVAVSDHSGCGQKPCTGARALYLSLSRCSGGHSRTGLWSLGYVTWEENLHERTYHLRI